MHQGNTMHIVSLCCGRQVAEKLLREKLTGSIIYKHSDDFRYGKDTYHTESFNNTVNMFQDKRIAFGDMQYSLK